METPVVASFTAVRYSARRAAWGALHMASQRPLLRSVPGLRFAQLLGTGSGIGFSRVPDPRTWALFAVWDRMEAWDAFRVHSTVMRQYARRGEERYSLLMQPLSSHGRWGGMEPFGDLGPADARHDAPGEPIVVLTRATIRWRRLARFWSAVDPVSATLTHHPDLLLTFGAGEEPFRKQATLSVWRSAAAMRQWAYTARHADVVRRTRAEGWYAEELFARLRLLGSYGTLCGTDPLAGRGAEHLPRGTAR